MNDERLELIRGSGNVFRDFEQSDADLLQLKAVVAAEIIKSLDKEGMTVRQAQAATGIAAADFSRIRNADLGRFTLDRLVTVLGRLGSRVEISIRRPQKSSAAVRGPSPATRSPR
ncbi:MAG: helix-turn-helix domain-containing protein [Steroidobacteraceae bacterium]|nr:helix-turn-helix domain-containing protein [Steroidobacteraceae bacterium]